MDLKENCRQLESRIFNLKEKLSVEEFKEIEEVIKRIHNNEPPLRAIPNFVKLRVRSYNTMFLKRITILNSIWNGPAGGDCLSELDSNDFDEIGKIEEWDYYEDMYFKVESDGVIDGAIDVESKVIGKEVYQKILSRGYYSINIGLNDNKFSILILSIYDEDDV